MLYAKQSEVTTNQNSWTYPLVAKLYKPVWTFGHVRDETEMCEHIQVLLC